jgi:hypothetical protein
MLITIMRVKRSALRAFELVELAGDVEKPLLAGCTFDSLSQDFVFKTD